jgi:Uma2 family endonuclease
MVTERLQQLRIMRHAELRHSPRGDYRMAMPASTPQYTIEMLDAMPQEPLVRYELVGGFLIVTPAPSLLHNVIIVRIISRLRAAIPESAAHVVSPGEIRGGPGTSLQPDVFVCPSRFRLRTPWKDITERWLAAEVVSPSSKRYDREEKRAAYLEFGVPEYWVVDPEARTVEVWRTHDRQPRTLRDTLTWTAPSGHRVEIALDGLFEGVSQEK